MIIDDSVVKMRIAKKYQKPGTHEANLKLSESTNGSLSLNMIELLRRSLEKEGYLAPLLADWFMQVQTIIDKRRNTFIIPTKHTAIYSQSRKAIA